MVKEKGFNFFNLDVCTHQNTHAVCRWYFIDFSPNKFYFFRFYLSIQQQWREPIGTILKVGRVTSHPDPLLFLQTTKWPTFALRRLRALTLSWWAVPTLNSLLYRSSTVILYLGQNELYKNRLHMALLPTPASPSTTNLVRSGSAMTTVVSGLCRGLTLLHGGRPDVVGRRRTVNEKHKTRY